MTHLLAPRHVLRRAALAASALLIVAASAATLGARPAKAAECWGSSCDLVYPYLDYSYQYLAGVGWSNCANEQPHVDQTRYGDNFSITLWYSYACNSNWGRIQFPAGSGLHDVGVKSASPAWNDNSHETSDGDSSTYMVDGSYAAQAWGEDASSYAVTDWF